MKTILIPTDFSEVSKNAVEYGILLAKEKNAQVVLLHVFHIPVVATDDPVLATSFDQMEEDNMTFLKDIESELRTKYNFTNVIESINKPGFLIDEISEIVKEKSPDLIVMGITDAGKLSELFISSKSIGVIKKINCPVIIIPGRARYQKVSTIVFACDIEKTENISALEKVKEFVQLFDAKLLIFNKVENYEDKEREEPIFNEKFTALFQDIPHSIHFATGEELVISINAFIDMNNADLLIMIHKKHAFFSQLFRESNTKKMAFHSHIPLLAIHE